MSDRFPAPYSRQATLAAPARLHGVGVHTGSMVTAVLRPAPAYSGIRFLRTDLGPARGSVPATWQNVVDTRLSTVLGNAHGARIGTVEHLLAALRAEGVDNLVVELDGPEVPILDGSALPWIALLRRSGLRRQAAVRQVLRVLAPIEVDEGERRAVLLPAAEARFSIAIDFAHPAIGEQQADNRPDAGDFAEAIAPARTFGFLHEITALHAQGLARGGSMDNAVVLGEAGVLNPEGLRFADEFARHKLLDCVGDLYLAGAPIQGHVIARRPGHALNLALLKALHSAPHAFERVPADALPLAA